jgi:uncharacterized protein involved in exopolysaccharide biosynthesis
MGGKSRLRGEMMQALEERDMYIERQEAAIRDLRKEIRGLAARATASGNVNAVYLEQAARLRGRLTEATARLREINAAAGDAWLQLRRDVDSSVTALRTSVKAAGEALRGD